MTAGPPTTRWCGWSRPSTPGTPVFLAASSWAAKLGMVYAALRRPPLSGLLAKVSLSRTRQLAVVVGHLVAPTARLRTLDFEPDRSR
jgi:hypothetical protein